MSYPIDSTQITLDDLMERITQTDLVPSRQILTHDIGKKFHILKKHGILTLTHLRKSLKNPKNIPAFAEKTQISSEYLILLRREIESYFPKPFPLSSFYWLDQKEIKKLTEAGYGHTSSLYEAALNDPAIFFVESLSLSPDFIDTILSLAGLTRIQWVNPPTAQLLLAAGYPSAASVANATAELLWKAINDQNALHRFFTGKIQLRDIKRLTLAAAYADWTSP